MMATVLELDPVVMADDAMALAAIHEPGVALTVWQRDLPRDLTEVVDQLELDELDDLELLVECPPSVATLTASLIASGYAKRAAIPIAKDIAAHADRLAAITGAARLKLRLEVVETDACRRFHTDYVTLRLITTYRGQATQWVRIDRQDVVEQLRAGDAAIFKGRVLMREPAILHRSPPIAVSREQRLLLVLDPVMAD